jgi:hypothetical protein
VQRWIFSSLFENVELPSIPVAEIFQSVTGVFGGSARFLMVIGGGALAIAMGWILWRLRSRWFKLPARSPVHYHDPARRRIFAAYRRAQRELKSYRARAQTVHEHAANQPALDELAQLVEVAAYRKEPPDEEMVRRAREWKPQS